MPVVGRIMLVRVLEQAVTQIMQGVLLLYAQKQLKVDPSNNGFLLAFFGLLGVLAQVVLVPRLTAHFSESHLTLGGAAGMTLAYAGLAGLASWPAFLASLVLLQLVGAGGASAAGRAR